MNLPVRETDFPVFKTVNAAYSKTCRNATLTALVVSGFSAGVLAALLNLRSSAQSMDDGPGLMIPIATNAIIWWIVASLFCLPQIIRRAFRSADYFSSCLAVIGWKVSSHALLLSRQFFVVLIGGTILSYPVSLLIQSAFWRIQRRDSSDLLFVSAMHETISIASIITAAGFTAVSLLLSFGTIVASYSLGKIQENITPKKVQVEVHQPKFLKPIHLVVLAAIGMFWLGHSNTQQAGIFVIGGWVLLLFWATSVWTLPVIRGCEKLFAKTSKFSFVLSALGAFLAEQHGTVRSLYFPLVFTAGIPAIVLTVSRTEAAVLNQPEGGIASWDFLMLLGLPLLFVGLVSVVGYFTVAGRVSVTQRYHSEIGAPSIKANVVRQLLVPLFFLLLSLLTSLIFAVFAALSHAQLLGGSFLIAIGSLDFSVSLVLVASFAVIISTLGVLRVVKSEFGSIQDSVVRRNGPFVSIMGN